MPPAIGPSAAALCDLILKERSHPEQGFRACLGIVRLVKAFGANGWKRPRRGRSISAPAPIGSVKSILDNNLDRQPPLSAAEDGRDDPPSQHPWPHYYH